MSHPQRKLFIEKKHLITINKSINCGTSVIGTIVYKCISCLKEHFIFRRCGNRFCARCGYLETQKWANSTLSKLENIKHHHIVFTIPHLINKIAQTKNLNAIHNTLFKAAHLTILDFFKAKHNLKPGIVSVLHTFGSDLKYHPHVHLIVTAGGQNSNSEIIELKNDFLTTQRSLADMFRKRFLEILNTLFINNSINLEFSNLKNKRLFHKWINKLSSIQWIASIQKPLKDIFQIIGYVGRYTKRACLSEYKISSISNGRILFTANDYKNSTRGEKPKQRIIDLSFVQFLDRLLMHVPNKRFRTVRYAGIYNSHYLKRKNNQIRNKQNLEFDFNQHQIETLQFSQYRNNSIQQNGFDPLICPNCNKPMDFDNIYFSKYRLFFDDG